MRACTTDDNTLKPGSRRLQKALIRMVLTLAALGFTMAGPAAAVCENAPANASLSLGPVTHSVKKTSNDGSYANVGCHYYVVDISVPSNSSGTGKDLQSFTIWTNFSDSFIAPTSAKVVCEANWEKTFVYKKAGGVGSFQLVGSWERKGKWLTGPGVLFPCVVVTLSGSTLSTLNPPANGTDVYRVVSARKYGGQWGTKFTTVTVEALHNSPQPEPPK
jgi:hypothetical protein